jgi:DNA-binding PadR family transcriptional regulator
MSRLLICCWFSFTCLTTTSQTTVDVDKERGVGGGVLKYVYTVAGTPFVTAKFSKVVEGSPFFNEQMMRGSIILSEGKEYRNILVRLNLLESQVNYIDEKQIEMIATTPISEVVLWDTINNNHHRFVFSNYIETPDKPEKDFYELLEAGKAELYKQYKKKMLESKPYGSATIEQSIKTELRYFVLISGKWVRIKKIKELTDLLTDKKNEIQKFIDDKKLTKDNEANFEALVAYYNTLPSQQ